MLFPHSICVPAIYCSWRVVVANAMPLPHEQLVTYWRANLNRSSAGGIAEGGDGGGVLFAVDDVVELPSDLCGSTEPVFIRDEYNELAKVIVSQMNLADSDTKNISVYGTPGIGKSVFASLLIFYLARASPKSVVLYTACNSTSQGNFLVFSPNGNVQYMSAQEGTVLISQLGDLDSSDLVWVIVDGYEPPPGTLNDTKNKRLRTVMVSSSNLDKKHWLHEWDKHVQLRLLMPPFSWEDMQYALKIRTPPELLVERLVVAEERFLVFGGIPRFVLKDTPMVDVWLRTALPGADKDLLFRTLTDTAEGQQTASFYGKSRLIHLYPSYDVPEVHYKSYLNYELKVPRFASEIVYTALMGRLDQRAQLDAWKKLHEACVNDDGAIVSLLFEPFMHAQLRGGTFLTSSKDKLFGRPEQSLLFDNTMTVYDAPECVYMQPKSKSFASIDSFIKLCDENGNQRVMLFQMTGQLSHPINMPGLKRLFTVPEGTPGAVPYQETRKRGGAAVTRYVLVPAGTTLTFIVTPHRHSAFAVPQGFVGAKNGVRLQCTAGVESYISEQISQKKVAPLI